MKIYSIFQSVDGEVNNRGMGAMTVFIRLAGCSAKCSYCDTEYAKSADSGTDMLIDEVVDKVLAFDCKNVTITGGEPLEQAEELRMLLILLDNHDLNVSIETNGFEYFNKDVYPYSNMHWVVDIKKDQPTTLPCVDKRYPAMNLEKTDYIKMVIGDSIDFVQAVHVKEILQRLGVKATFAFSPEYSSLSPDELLSWMKKHKQTDAVLSVQLHKVLNLSEAN